MMIVVGLLWVAGGPLMLLMAVVLVECAIFLRDERSRAGTLAATVAAQACRRTARRAAVLLLVGLALQLGIFSALSGSWPSIVALWVPWYYIGLGVLYPPLLFLPVGLLVAVVFLTRYLTRAPARWREAGSRALTHR